MHDYCFIQTANFVSSAVKKYWIRYYDTFYERDGINYVWSIKNSNDVLNKFISDNSQASKLSTYDFSTLYSTLLHHLIKDKLIDLINRTFIRENTQYLACNEECIFFSLLMYTIITIYGRIKKSVIPLFIFWIIFLLDLELNFIGKLLVFRWELIMLLLLQIFFFFFFFFCYERDFITSLSCENQANIIDNIEAFNSTRCLDDLLNIDNIYFDRLVGRIYPKKLQLNRANSSDTEASFFWI